VHPAHARKMAARMIEKGHSIFYYETVEGGHGASSTNEQAAFNSALKYSYLWYKLK
jgi:prolyl oligopeptidase